MELKNTQPSVPSVPSPEYSGQGQERDDQETRAVMAMIRAAKSAPSSGSGTGADSGLHADVLAAQLNDSFDLLMAFRFVNAMCVWTFFQPDEYFQALEPAWDFAFGRGSGAWLTWEWEHQLRSSLHPVLFGLLYKAANWATEICHLDPIFKSFILRCLPGCLQGVFAALGDFYTLKLAMKIFGKDSNVAWAAMWISVLSPWQWYCSTRTFSNSLEMTLTVAALYFWPWELLSDAKAVKGKVLHTASAIKGLRLSLALAAVAVLLRPTNLLIWLTILLLTTTRMTLDGESPMRKGPLLVLSREVLLCGSTVLALSAASDRLFFGSWTFPPYTWLHFNLSQDLAVFYGQMPWHYYISQGLPLLTTTVLPFACVGIQMAMASSSKANDSESILRNNILKTLSFIVLTTVATFSVISHKEVRFIYPVLPILHVLAAQPLTAFFTKPLPPSPPSTSIPDRNRPHYENRRKPVLAAMLAFNLALGFYLGFSHQGAPIAVTSFLRREFERLHGDALHLPSTPVFFSSLANATAAAAANTNASDASRRPQQQQQDEDLELFALFLTPCHTTPWRSHLVWPALRARALTCEPPLHTAPGSAARAAYRDEADRFFDAPGRFLREELGLDGHSANMPRYLVGFEGIEGALRDFFAEADNNDGEEKVEGETPHPLRRVWEGWNGLFNEEERRQGRLVVWDTGAYSSTEERAMDYGERYEFW